MAKVIMIQGTMSNVGKSLLTAALCRIFRQDGYACAPFKAQNMALNSFITKDGLELGRAQAMQAQAAGIEPSALMNPILLKPTTDVGSQVIVNGKVRGNFRAAEYFKYKKELIPDILAAYHTLAKEHDIIVIEGAGSPVELNLKTDDIVNMGMAKLVNAPVLLAGDIDRGGIFPQLLGTLSLLEPEELQRVKGLIVNKFRGDRALFQSGVDLLEAKGKKPVVGVVPYVDCDIDDEDSLSDKLQKNGGTAILDIAVIRLPRISNFTDFDSFSQYPDVSVRYVTKPEQLGLPDLILLPGTKSTISDLQWLRNTGLETVIQHCVAMGTPLFGICGGYQMLGQSVSDPFGVEGGGTVEGMGLLPCRTVFAKEKYRSQTTGQFAAVPGIFSALSQVAFSGYEIHMGQTESDGTPLLSCGGTAQGNVYGCYIHGIFDSHEVTDAILQALYRRRGLSRTASGMDRTAYQETQFDLLAQQVRQNLDMQQIYEILRHSGQRI